MDIADADAVAAYKCTFSGVYTAQLLHYNIYSDIQWTLFTMTSFVPKNCDVKLNLLF